MSHAGLRVLRRGLWPLSCFYGGAVRIRNALFDRRLRRIERLPVPVVSVGNVTVGGTGKTPLVMWLVETLRQLARRPGVLARGYGRATGAALNDEGAMLAARYPGLLQVQDPDRVRGGRRLVELGADVVVLDDGFQHRRLHRGCDLVCVDALAPFQGALLLPAGDLREPVVGLGRADAVVLTRADGLSEAGRETAVERLRRACGRDLPVFAARHAPRDLVMHPGGESFDVDALRGRRVGLLSAIGRPEAFEATVAALGADVAWSVRCRDHHRFGEDELREVADRARRDGVTLVVTEKDEPKLASCALPRWVLRVDLRFLGEAPGAASLGLEASS